MAEELAARLGRLSLQDGADAEGVASPVAFKPSDLAGMDDVLGTLREVVDWPIRYRKEAAALGLTFPKGVLLHGPPGTGKTSAVLQIVRETGADLHRIDPGDVIGSYLGESERRLRDRFAAARTAASEDPSRPVVIFLDEADALCAKRSTQRAHEGRIVGQLLTLMDGAEEHNLGGGHVVVIGTTQFPDALDAAFRRPGRFDLEVAVPVPDGPTRAKILSYHARSLPLGPGLDIEVVAADCFGYSGADLAALCREAALLAVDRARGEQGEEFEIRRRSKGDKDKVQQDEQSTKDFELSITVGDFAAARRTVGPSIARGLTLDFVPVSWDKIGGLENVKRRLQQAVEWPIRQPGALTRLGLRAPRGVLLYGPPGCSKTTLARAAATASGATFVALSAAQLFSQYVGEGEAILRAAFSRARLASPSILFLDELDALVARRSEEAGKQQAVASRILSTFLTEMDGLEGTKAGTVLVLGATNRPQAIDDAMLRPGRFDVLLFVPPPDEEGRQSVLQIHTAAMPLADDVDLSNVASKTERFTGAELAQVCREAAMAAIRERASHEKVTAAHFESALQEVRPALSQHDIDLAAAWRRRRM